MHDPGEFRFGTHVISQWRQTNLKRARLRQSSTSRDHKTERHTHEGKQGWNVRHKLRDELAKTERYTGPYILT